MLSNREDLPIAHIWTELSAEYYRSGLIGPESRLRVRFAGAICGCLSIQSGLDLMTMAQSWGASAGR